MSSTMELERRYALPVVAQRDLVLVEGSGATVTDDTGRTYIDCVSGHGVAVLGHCNPAIVQAIQRQASRLIACGGLFGNDVRAQLLEELVRITPDGLGRAFLCNSGTEAVEASLKLARATTGRSEIVCARKGFHGRTLGSLSATFEPKYRAGFEPLVPGFHHVPFNDIDSLEQALSPNTAAVLLEPVQGEGGVHVARPEYLRQVRRLCDANGCLLILDEVQTGFCRTGRIFACEHFGVEPDILCLAKGMAGGFPIGAVVCGDRVEATHGMHGSTFGGNPLACAAALAAIGFMEEHRIAEEAASKGAYLMEGLREHDLDVVREVRGLGLMIGIGLRRPARPFLEHLTDQGVLALPAGKSVLRLLPPLVIEHHQLDTVIEALVNVLATASLRRPPAKVATAGRVVDVPGI